MRDDAKLTQWYDWARCDPAPFFWETVQFIKYLNGLRWLTSSSIIREQISSIQASTSTSL
jgi:hypothetical protein